MRLLTVRDRIRNVLAAWDRQYGNRNMTLSDGQGSDEKKARLEKLDLGSCRASEVDDVIGNCGWTTCNCDECGRDVDRVMIVGTDSTSVQLCKDCLVEAIQQLGRP